jgi:nucleotide-binding universal stress UspA family protein
MFKRILVAIDGSPTANRGLKLALDLAKEHDATLHVLHVVDDIVLWQSFGGEAYVPPEYVDSLLASLRAAGRKILARAEKAANKQGYPVQPLLVETLGQSVAHAVLAQARKLRVELIVLGTHGRRGLTRLVMGSDAEAIVREASVPVLLVRSAAPVHSSPGAGSGAEARLPATRGRSKASAAAAKQLAQRKRAT